MENKINVKNPNDEKAKKSLETEKEIVEAAKKEDSAIQKDIIK